MNRKLFFVQVFLTAVEIFERNEVFRKSIEPQFVK